MIKLSAQQIKALALKIMQEHGTKIIDKKEKDKAKFLSEHNKEIQIYLNACNTVNRARQALIATGSIEEYSLAGTNRGNREYYYDNLVKSIKTTGKTLNTESITNEILILSIDAETVSEIMEHFNTI